MPERDVTPVLNIENVLSETTVLIPVLPVILKVSPPLKVSTLPELAANENEVETAALDADVILPCSSIVRIGMLVALPYVVAITPVADRVKLGVQFSPVVPETIIPLPDVTFPT